MTVKYDPDHTIHMSAHLNEFIEQWQKDPASALACATRIMTRERAQELIDGAEWRVTEVAAVGQALGPSTGFWLNLYRNYRGAVEDGKEVVRGD